MFSGKQNINRADQKITSSHYGGVVGGVAGEAAGGWSDLCRSPNSAFARAASAQPSFTCATSGSSAIETRSGAPIRVLAANLHTEMSGLEMSKRKVGLDGNSDVSFC